MTHKEHLLVILMEECSETAQRASKALRFSLEEVQPGQVMTNTERLIEEFCDVVAAMEMLQEHGYVTVIYDQQRIEAKKKQVIKFLRHSQNNGTLIEPPTTEQDK